MTFTSGDIAVIISAVAVLLGAYATYRNSVRKSEFEKLQARVVETEKRLADAEKRASDNERRASEYRNDVIQLGEELSKERNENARRLAMVAQDGNDKIRKVVLVLEKVVKDFETATSTTADVDMDVLKRLVVIDHITGPLGSLDSKAVQGF